VYFNKLKGAVYLSLNALNIHLNHYLSFATTALFKATGIITMTMGGCKGT
jgi:hypothetical protein